MKKVKYQKSIGNTDQSTEQLLHTESKANFLAHETDSYDGVSDQSTKNK